jgi:hypothetical protein
VAEILDGGPVREPDREVVEQRRNGREEVRVDLGGNAALVMLEPELLHGFP